MSDERLIDRLRGGPPVLMDGAMNTELAKKGLVFNEVEWLRVNVANPSLVAEVHATYAKIGAQIHIANSFATAKHVTEYYGMADQFRPLNEAAVHLCKDAVSRVSEMPQWVAGSISTYAPGHDRSKLPPLRVMEQNTREQAEILAEAGCDLIVLEMIADAATGNAMVRGASKTGLPIAVGITCGFSDTGDIQMQHRSITPERLRDGIPKIIDGVSTDAGLILSIMHADVSVNRPALAEIRELWPGLIGAYPHTGQPDGVGGWDMSHACTIDAFTDCAREAISDGVCFIGGCCGIGPDYISALHEQLIQRLRK